MSLTSCVPSKVSLENQTKDNSANIESAEVSENLQSRKTENKVNALSISKGTTQSENLLNDKGLSDLAKKLQSSRLDTLSNSTIICTINGDPITVGDYRHQFKIEQEQMQASLAMNPQVSNNLIHMAQEQGVSLSLEEKKHLVNSANKMQTGGTKGFNKMLAENHMTKNQFQDQVCDIGLAFKMAGKLIEDGLLNELVSRKLLSQAAKENGYSKEALNKYTEVSKDPKYKRLMQVSGISPDDLRDEIISNELCLKQIEKIKSESPISDTEISNYYEKNRGKFRHDARIRLSQIFISKTKDGTENPTAAKLKLQKENPKLSEAELNKQFADLEKQKEKLAQDVLQRARNGEDFGHLANQYSEDPDNAAQKNGGDAGFQEETKLDKSFADKVTKLPVGSVTPELIANPYGFYIFKVTAKESKGFYNLNEIKDGLKRLLAQEKGQQVVADWLANVSRKAVIAMGPEMKDLIASNKLQKRIQ